MPPVTNQNFNFHIGDDIQLPFEVTDDADEIVDVGGMSARLLAFLGSL